MEELKTVEFEAKYDIYEAVPLQPCHQTQETVLKKQGSNDKGRLDDARRIRVLDSKVGNGTSETPFWYWHQIGLLRMVFDNKKVYTGTATVFHVIPNYKNSKSSICYALTAAHNLISYDPFEKKTFRAQFGWFDRRVSKSYIFWQTSEKINSYNVLCHVSHPEYCERSLSAASYDIAIIAFIDEYNFFYKNRKQFWKLPYEARLFASVNSKADIQSDKKKEELEEKQIENDINAKLDLNVYIGGFPEEKKGQLLEAVCLGSQCYPNNDGTIIKHKIDTTGGQSGSAIVRLEFKGTDLLIEWMSKNIAQVNVDIIGIHTKGDDQRVTNSGVIITKDLKDWIKGIVEQYSQCGDKVTIRIGKNTYLQRKHGAKIRLQV